MDPRQGVLNNNDAVNTTARVNCRTVAGTDTDTQLVGTDANNTNDDARPWANSLVHTFAAAGTIVLQCTGNPVQIAVEDRKIQALQVREITSTP